MNCGEESDSKGHLFEEEGNLQVPKRASNQDQDEPSIVEEVYRPS
jgi:hypothetical protein